MAVGCCSRRLKPRVMPPGAGEFEALQTFIGNHRIRFGWFCSLDFNRDNFLCIIFWMRISQWGMFSLVDL
jgi:hypothetical protein